MKILDVILVKFVKMKKKEKKIGTLKETCQWQIQGAYPARGPSRVPVPSVTGKHIPPRNIIPISIDLL